MKFSRSLLQSVLTLSLSTLGFAQGTGSEAFPRRDRELTDRGRELSSIYCRSCHDYRRTHIGPKLGGITRYRTREWLMDFVKDPAGLAASGDETAIELIARYKVPMPGFANLLTDDDLEAIFSSIASYSDRRNLTFDPLEDNPRIQEMLTIPTEPAPPATHALVLEDVVTMPVIPSPRDIARIATLRTVPGDDSGDLYISNQDGAIYRIQNGQSERVLNIRDRVPDFFNYLGLASSGLGSFDFHPEFKGNGLIYLSHTVAYSGQKTDYLPDGPLEEPVMWVVSEIRVQEPGKVEFAGASWREMLRIALPTTVHGMQDIAFPFLLAPVIPTTGYSLSVSEMEVPRRMGILISPTAWTPHWARFCASIRKAPMAATENTAFLRTTRLWGMKRPTSGPRSTPGDSAIPIG